MKNVITGCSGCRGKALTGRFGIATACWRWTQNISCPPCHWLANRGRRLVLGFKGAPFGAHDVYGTPQAFCKHRWRASFYSLPREVSH